MKTLPMKFLCLLILPSVDACIFTCSCLRNNNFYQLCSYKLVVLVFDDGMYPINTVAKLWNTLYIICGV